MGRKKLPIRACLGQGSLRTGLSPGNTPARTISEFSSDEAGILGIPEGAQWDFGPDYIWEWDVRERREN